MRFPPRPLHLAALLIAAASVSLVLALGSSASALGTCTDNFTGASGGDWATAANWDGGVPTSTSVACFSGKSVVVSTGTQQAASIQGGTLSITGGSLKLNSATDDSQVDGLAIGDGSLTGPSGRTLTVAGDFDWNDSFASGINSGSGGLAIAQTGTHNFTIEGNGQTYLQGGSLTTPNAVSITAKDFIATNSPTLTTTSTVTFASGSYTANGGAGVTISAAGFVTSGDTSIPNYSLHLTGSSSSLSGTLTVPVLNVDASKTLTVPSGAGVAVGSGTISGTVTGAGTWTQTGSTTHIASGAELSTDHVAETGGQLTLDSGGTYSAATSTNVSGGTMTLQDDASTGSFTMTAGNLTGTSGKTLTVAGNFDWNVGFASGINSGSGGLAIDQTGTHNFTIEGNGQAYLQGGSLSTSNPVSISATDFINTGSPAPSLTTTSTVTFAPGSYTANGGTSLTINAAGVVTTGDTSIPNYGLHLTGSSTSLSGTLTVPVLNTDASTTTTVASGAELKVGGGTISGTISGAGTYTQTGTSTIASGGELSTDHVTVPSGQLTAALGSTYDAATSTSISGGTLTLHDDASTGSLTVTSGSLTGSSGKTLTVAGDFDWNVGFASGINSGSGGLAIDQTGTHSFTIEGGGQAYLQGGSLSTSNPVSISDTDFINTGSPAPSLTTTSTVTFAPGSYSANGGASLALSAAGFVTSGNTSLPNYALHLTGGTMSVPSGRTVAPGAMTVEGGTLQVDGTMQSATTVSGGTLKGAGTISGALTNSGGTVAPGDSPGTLSVTGNYTQASGGTLAIAVNGTSAGQFSVLAVGGDANLDGTLALQPSAGYAGSAAAGDRVAFLTYGPTRSGTFANTTVTPPLTSGAPMTADYSNAHEVDAVVGNAPPPPPPGDNTKPSISGGTVEGDTLSATQGSWTNSPNSYTYQWQLCDASGSNCTDIAGATGSTYTLTAGDVGHTVQVVVTAENGGGSTHATSAATAAITAPPAPAPAPPPAVQPAPIPLPLSCSGRPIVLLDVHSSGRKVLASGLALPKYAGQAVTIKPSVRKAKAGHATVNADGTFSASLPAPKGRHAGSARYQAIVAGQRSLSLKLTRQLVITSERAGAGGLRVSMRLLQGRTGQKVTITRQESCTKSVLFKNMKAGRGGRFTVTLPTPSGSGALAFYRASAALRRHGKTYSLPVTVRAAG